MSVAPTLSSAPEYAKVEQRAQAPSVDPAALDEVYHIEDIAAHILENDYQVPCLQFPDDLVCDSTHVASRLQDRIARPVYVLADTSYSPCCVDEIAAQHVSGDVVFHFGNACLNATRTLPAVYVSRQELGTDSEAVLRTIGAKEKYVLYSDTTLVELMLDVYALSDQNDAQEAVVAVPSSSTAAFIPEVQPRLSCHMSCAEIPNRLLSKKVKDLGEYDFIYLTDDPSESLLLHWSTVFKTITVINGRGEQLNVNVALKKRYRFVQNVKAAGTIGILVNTLSLRDTASLLSRTKQAIIRAEKKYYMFVVGKPNIAKLGNFEAIDVWVILGCPQGGVIVDSDEYFKPIVTPYELELAFDDTWTGRWVLDFNQVLQSESNDEASDGAASSRSSASGTPREVSDEPLFDLVTGKFVFDNAPLRQIQHLDLNYQELQTTSQAVTMRNTVSTAAAKLQQRSWQGLGSDHQDLTEEFAELKKGRSGIARNYQEKA